MSSTAFVLGIVAGRRRAARIVLSVLVVAAGLEAFAGVCLACKLFPLLVRAGLVHEDACPDCNDIWSRTEPPPHP